MDQWLAVPMVLVDDTEPVCRICHGGGSSSASGRLHKFCKCRGSIQFVHRLCLTRWFRATTERTCELCGHHYHVVRTAADYCQWLVQNKNKHLPSHCYILLVEFLCIGSSWLALHLVSNDCNTVGLESCSQSQIVMTLILLSMFSWFWYGYLLTLWFSFARRWWKGVKNGVLVLDIEDSAVPGTK